MIVKVALQKTLTFFRKLKKHFSMIAAQLKDFPVRDSIVVAWSDMDAAQHVNNTVYLVWVERLRITYFDALGYDVSPGGNRAGFILAWTDCKYIFPVTYPDTVVAGVRINTVEADRFTMETHLFSEKHQRIVAISKQIVVCYDYTALKKVAIPAELRLAMEKVEGKKF